MNNRVIAYRPEMNTAWGGTLPNLFVEQVKFWWEAMGRKPFYKFNDKPNKPNKFYKDGDSWQEELCWSRTELETARDSVAVKATPKDDKRKLLKDHVVVYWRDSKNRLWYALSEEVYYAAFAKVYGIEQGPEEPPADENDETTGEKSDQPEPPADTPECGHSAFANDDIRQPDNNIEDSSDINNKNKGETQESTTPLPVDEFGIPENPIKKDKDQEKRKPPDWINEVLPGEDELPPFGKPRQIKRLKLEWRELWEKNGFPLISPILRDNLVNLIDRVGEDIYRESIEIAVKRDVKTYAYVERVALNKLQEKLNGEKDKPASEQAAKGVAANLAGRYADEVER
jgi:DnaD/phage-associated family protein